MAHAEGLAGQHAAQHNALEQVSLRKVGQQNGRGWFGRVGGQRQRRAFAVDVVHGHAGMGGQKVRQKCLHTADGQRRGRVGQRDGTLAVGIGQAQTLVGHRRTAPLLLVPGVERGIQLLGTDAEHDAVDRLDLNGGAVDVADLGQAPARRMGPALLLAQGGLQLLPVGLGGSPFTD